MCINFYVLYFNIFLRFKTVCKFALCCTVFSPLFFSLIVFVTSVWAKVHFTRLIFRRQHKIAIKALSSSETVSGFWDSRGGINITRTPHNVRLYVHCLSWLLQGRIVSIVIRVGGCTGRGWNDGRPRNTNPFLPRAWMHPE